MQLPFHDRREAGRLLAGHLLSYSGREGVVVLGLPRGGVPVAYEVAQGLGARLDVFVVRKLGVPGHEELAMGAIASGGICVLNEEVVGALHISEAVINRVFAVELRELARREALYRAGKSAAVVKDRVVILIDDGLATGATMRAAAGALRRQHPRRLVVAVPVAAAEICEILRDEVDEVVCAATPEPFYGVGRWYRDFSQTSDDEVRALLESAAHAEASPSWRQLLKT